MTRISLILASVVATSAWSSAALGADPFFIQLPFLPNSFDSARALAVSSNGSCVAGWDATTVNSFAEMVRWSGVAPGGATSEGLGVPAWGSRGMFPSAISDDGLVVAGWALNLDSEAMATRWADPSAGGPGFTALGVLPGGPHPVNVSLALAMLADGTVVVGRSDSVDFATGTTFSRPFRWALTDAGTGAGEMLALPLLDRHDQGAAHDMSDDGRTIVGWNGSVGDDGLLQRVAVRWIDGSVTPFELAEPGLSLLAISPDGVFIVGLAFLDGTNVPFRWTSDRGMQLLPQPPHGNATNLTAVANDGTAIGWVGNDSGALWTPSGEAHDIATWFLKEFGLDASAWLLHPQNISGDGRTIVGSGDLGVPATAPWLAFLGAPVTCLADLDDDGAVGFRDLLEVLSNWGPCGDPCPEDLDESGDVGFPDLLAVLSAWGECA